MFSHRSIKFYRGCNIAIKEVEKKVEFNMGNYEEKKNRISYLLGRVLKLHPRTSTQLNK